MSKDEKGRRSVPRISDDDEPPEKADPLNYEHDVKKLELGAVQIDKVQSGSQQVDAPISVAEDPWDLCAKHVWEYEKAMVIKWKEDIGNLLVFTGLFLTILTGFIIAFYPMLRPQPPDPTTQVLLIISAQLAMVTASLGQPNLTEQQVSVLTGVGATTHPTPSVLSTGNLWFIAMICSISAAAIAIAVGQWLHHYVDRASSVPRKSVHIWYFRRRGLKEWHMQLIIDALPILLQISMALFLVGLIQLLWTLDDIVAATTTALVALLILPPVFTIFMPTFSPECPYKSRTSWWAFRLLRWLIASTVRCKVSHPRVWSTGVTSMPNRIMQLFGQTLMFMIQLCCLPSRMFHVCRKQLPTWIQWYVAAAKVANWREFEEYAVRSQSTTEQEENRLLMLAEADEIVMDDTFLTTVVQPCLRENGLPNALPVLYRILEHRAHEIDSHTTPPTLRWHPNDRDAPAIIAMGDLCVDVLSKYPTVHVDNSDDDQKRIMHNLLHLVRAMPATDSARAICKRVAELVQSHGEEWFRWVLNGDIVSRLHELSSGPNTFILEFVARDWLKGLHFSDALVHFNKIFEPQLLLNNDVHAIKAYICIDIFAGIKRTQSHFFDYEGQQMRLLDEIERLLAPIPSTETSVYAQFTELLMKSDVSHKVRAKLAWKIRIYSHKFPPNIKNTRSLLTYLWKIDVDYHTQRVLWTLSTALHFATRLPQGDLTQIRNNVVTALAATAGYFNARQLDSIVGDLMEDGGWFSFYTLLCVCDDLVRTGDNMFAPDIVSALQRCAEQCPAGHVLYEDIQRHMRNTRELSKVQYLPRKDTGQTLVGDTQASPGLASSSHGGAERAGLSYSVLRHYETH
ncbi:hypothetical protein IEO21_04416 [Rhodonia placenta]|uniref:DUF6535 domain-containing protein n=1 Tax=Rhodonia placenta TaxID=104341 RepID=A0A8H7P4E2_9APHY|nr:hypothetical protein IEO21_04416 [Postia placenta]